MFGRCETFYRVLDHHLTFLQHVHELNADEHGLGCRKRLEPEHGAGDPLDTAMVLFHHVVEILDLADFDRGAVLLIVALDGSVANFDFRGKIRKIGISNSMTYRPPNARKSKFATEPKKVGLSA